jgi:putative oxidoreductase
MIARSKCTNDIVVPGRNEEIDMSTSTGARVAPNPPRTDAGPSASKLHAWSPHARAILRIITGLLFIEHGLVKLVHFPAANPQIPDPLPALLVAAALIELVGGLLIAAGLFTRIVAFICAGEMAVAYFMVHAPQNFWPEVNKGEGAILYCFIFLYFVFAGGGAWSLDGLVRKRS